MMRVIVGTAGSGKTTYIKKELLKRKDEFKKIAVISYANSVKYDYAVFRREYEIPMDLLTFHSLGYKPIRYPNVKYFVFEESLKKLVYNPLTYSKMYNLFSSYGVNLDNISFTSFNPVFDDSLNLDILKYNALCSAVIQHIIGGSNSFGKSFYENLLEVLEDISRANNCIYVSYLQMLDAYNKYPSEIIEILKEYDLIIIDEAQDTPYHCAKFISNRLKNMTEIWVAGDPYQTIYGGLGSKIEYETSFDIYYSNADEVIKLTKTHRFGIEICEKVNAFYNKYLWIFNKGVYLKSDFDGSKFFYNRGYIRKKEKRHKSEIKRLLSPIVQFYTLAMRDNICFLCWRNSEVKVLIDLLHTYCGYSYYTLALKFDLNVKVVEKIWEMLNYLWGVYAEKKHFTYKEIQSILPYLDYIFKPKLGAEVFECIMSKWSVAGIFRIPFCASFKDIVKAMYDILGMLNKNIVFDKVRQLLKFIYSNNISKLYNFKVSTVYKFKGGEEDTVIFVNLQPNWETLNGIYREYGLEITYQDVAFCLNVALTRARRMLYVSDFIGETDFETMLNEVFGGVA